MGINGLCRHAPPHIQHDIGRFAAHAWERDKCCAGIGDLAAIVLNQDTAELDDVFGFVAEEADCLDMLNQTLFAQSQHLFGCIGNFEKFFCGFVHAYICGLGGERHGDDKGIDIHMIELAHGGGICCVKAGENLSERLIIELLGHGEGMPARGATGKILICAGNGSRGGVLGARVSAKETYDEDGSARRPLSLPTYAPCFGGD